MVIDIGVIATNNVVSNVTVTDETNARRNAMHFYWAVSPRTFAVRPYKEGLEMLRKADAAIREVRKMQKSETHFSRKRVFKCQIKALDLKEKILKKYPELREWIAVEEVTYW